MKKNYFIILLACLFSGLVKAQVQNEIDPPFNIKTVSFVQNGQNVIPIFNLQEGFQLQFDDLYGNEANYYYEIVHCNYDWTPSQLVKSEYIQGFDNQRIQDYENSFNTLQLYSHYRLPFPNKFTQFRVSGNYIIKILNEDRDVVFSRKFILYEDQVSVPLQIKRARDVRDINYMHNLDFAIKSASITFINPLQSVKVMLLQNGQFKEAIYNIKPQYTIGNDLIYKYDKETQFWAGNEFLYFDNKEIRAVVNNINYVRAKDLYEPHLYINRARANQVYTYYPDVNGNFVVRNFNTQNNEIEADYAWVYFTLDAPNYFGKSDIYINGMFNNYALNDENRMDFNQKTGMYEKAIVIKQGFTNYQYVIADKKGKIDHANAVDGNFYQTENNYQVIVYYRGINERYDKVIGRGTANSENIVN
ncbi:MULTISPECIES: DUF5103 domain-containing protein [Flavobacterium]|jgi:hypothetical protein|uniref:type IX secretion system plug protein n=1 Tax=Flavobacterium TaxID=237 RepID=UPI0006F7C3E7|nr:MULTISPECIES: DUF5103 domain-containing protein [Flavobacterium]KQS50275.1 hypothetical protein ASG38_04705 [Flavobacterium sp. Leaf359]PZO28032.1 MAG: DUF5103 domain-containing protein [Flavobacteriaceae bacterium]PZQ91378.1 MAG: DUF5103 domain-containing protein [Flavobacterium johnsoniae]